MFLFRESTSYNFLIFVVFIFNLFLLLKIFNEKRFNSIYKFWLNDTFNIDIEKPLVIRNDFSTSGFIIRALVFATVVKSLIEKEISANIIDIDIVKYFILFSTFWIIRMCLEILIIKILKIGRQILKFSYLRSIVKEKLSFFYLIIIILFIYFEVGGVVLTLTFIPYLITILYIHVSSIKNYFKVFKKKKVMIILYICTSEFAPLCLMFQLQKILQNL